MTLRRWQQSREQTSNRCSLVRSTRHYETEPRLAYPSGCVNEREGGTERKGEAEPEGRAGAEDSGEAGASGTEREGSTEPRASNAIPSAATCWTTAAIRVSLLTGPTPPKHDVAPLATESPADVKSLLFGAVYQTLRDGA
ncbi:hypothetical protein PF010_g21060 [Phytophthora fragariae]|uniref:Uncharacterized protein n=1 Tax=Phytophthora fragariae TaxID=53985 RepID=A0A6G0KCE7_9STRA|nr:hypothetical protein PF010_g21060 [Phytophthora fragariae]